MATPPRVWVRNPDAASDAADPFVLATVVGESADSPGDLTVKLANKKQLEVHGSDVFTANPDGFSCPDNTMLIHLSEATLLANLRDRYAAKEIYTLTGSILLVRARSFCAHAEETTLSSFTRGSRARANSLRRR